MSSTLSTSTSATSSAALSASMTISWCHLITNCQRFLYIGIINFNVCGSFEFQAQKFSNYHPTKFNCHSLFVEQITYCLLTKAIKVKKKQCEILPCQSSHPSCVILSALVVSARMQENSQVVHLHMCCLSFSFVYN